MPEETLLSIEIKNTQPVELDDLTAALSGIAEEYKRHVLFGEQPSEFREVKLFVKEMRGGSIIADLVTYGPLVFPFIVQANEIVEFTKHLKRCYDYLLARNQEKPANLEKADLVNLSKIVEPIAKDNGAQINIATAHFHSPVQITINSLEANAAQNRIKREIELLQEPVTGVHEKVLLYWYQARNDPKSQAGDRAIIESISRSSVKAVFANESVKARMLLADDNPFTHAYVTDVAVETVKDRPALYRILNVHEKLDKPTDGTA
jgi:hypothetical protein